MFEIERVPGPCALCYVVCVELKRIPGRCGDGICEDCDRVRFAILRPDAEFMSWGEQKARARAAQEARFRPSRPADDLAAFILDSA